MPKLPAKCEAVIGVTKEDLEKIDLKELYRLRSELEQAIIRRHVNDKVPAGVGPSVTPGMQTPMPPTGNLAGEAPPARPKKPAKKTTARRK